jgi:hypothetical protein
MSPSAEWTWSTRAWVKTSYLKIDCAGNTQILHHLPGHLQHVLVPASRLLGDARADLDHGKRFAVFTEVFAVLKMEGCRNTRAMPRVLTRSERAAL